MQPENSRLFRGVNVGPPWLTLLLIGLAAFGAMSFPQEEIRKGAEMDSSASRSLDEIITSVGRPAFSATSGTGRDEEGSAASVRKTSTPNALKGQSIVYFDLKQFQVDNYEDSERGADVVAESDANGRTPKCMLILKDGSVQDSRIVYIPPTKPATEFTKPSGLSWLFKRVPLDRMRLLLSSRSSTSIKAWFDNTPDALRQHLLQQTDVIQAIARCTLNGWDNVPAESVIVTRLNGALSNELFLVELSRKSDDNANLGTESQDIRTGGECQDLRCPNKPCVSKALVRVYGHQEQTAFFDSREERRLFIDLGKRGIAPKCLAEFEGGRIETYIDALPLKTSDLNRTDILTQLTVSIAEFHAVVPHHLESPHILLQHENVQQLTSGEPLYRCTCVLCRIRSWGLMAIDAWKLAIQQTSEAEKAIPVSPQVEVPSDDEESMVNVGSYLAAKHSFSLHESTLDVFNNLKLHRYLEESKWLVKEVLAVSAADVLYLDEFRKRLETVFGPGVRFNGDDMPNDLLWLSGTFIVLSHNDFQENNVLRTSDDKLHLIDFEYSGMSLQAFDLANLFCEATFNYTDAGKWPFFYHFPNNMPSKEVRKDMIKIYLESIATKKRLSIPLKDVVTEEVVQRFFLVVEYMILASHLMWAFWSVVRAKVPEDPSSFSYLEYSSVRFAMYNKKKEELLDSLKEEA